MNKFNVNFQQVVSQGYRNLAHPFNKTWQKEGFSGFFRGLTPSLAQIALNTGQFLNYILPYFYSK
jgi:hypothetical protein